MKKTTLFFLVNLFAFSNLDSALAANEDLYHEIDKLKNNTLPDLKDILLCTQTLSAMTKNYRLIKEAFFLKTSPESPLNQFKNVQLNHQKMIKMLEEYAKDSKKFGELDRDQLISKISELTKQKGSLIDQFDELSITESLFISKLESIRSYLLEQFDSAFIDIQLLHSQQCHKAGVREGLVVLQKDFAQNLNSISRLYYFTLEARKKRSTLLHIVFNAIKSNLENVYTEKARFEINAKKDEIKKILDLTNISAEYYSWQGKIQALGAADSLDTKYLQYERPLRLLAIRVQEVRDFRKRIEAIPELPPSSEIVLDHIRNTENYLETKLQKLKESGWEAQWNKQNRMIEKRLEFSNLHPNECKKDFVLFLDTSYKIKDQESFRLNEAFYQKLVDECFVKGEVVQ